MKKYICFFLSILLLSTITYAIGISPGKRTYDFVPGLSGEIEFSVINSEEQILYADIYVLGTLEEYFDLERTNIELAPGESRAFKTTFTLPFDIDLPPGEHRTDIVARQLPGPPSGLGSEIGAVAAVGLVTIVKVPYDGKYLDIKIEVDDKEVGENVNFKIILEALGKQTVSNVGGVLTIKDPDNKTVDTLDFTEDNILFQEIREVSLVWNSGDNEAAIYNAILDINYDGKIRQVEKEFRLGDLLIKILDLKERKIFRNQINAMEILTQSVWNGEIKHVFAELEIADKKTRSESNNYELWEEKAIPIYFDSTGLEKGNYEARVTLFYEGRITEKVFDVEITDRFLILNYTIYASIIVMIILIIFVLIRKSKLFKSKSKTK